MQLVLFGTRNRTLGPGQSVPWGPRARLWRHQCWESCQLPGPCASWAPAGGRPGSVCLSGPVPALTKAGGPGLPQEVAEAPRAMGPDALLKQKVKQKRFRDGYEEGLSTTHRSSSAAAFVLSDSPVEMLGRFTRHSSHACPPMPRRQLAEPCS
jgi:Domain of unknown function (DUF3381)